MTDNQNNYIPPAVMPDNNGGFTQFPELMTESELIQFLRIPLLSNSKKHANVIENLKRFHDLPCVHLCRKPLYPLNAIRQWIDDKLMKESRK